MLTDVSGRSAYDLVTLTAVPRRSGLEETSAQAVSLGELDNIDVFDFFNYPKVPEPDSWVPSGQTSILQQQGMQGVGGDMRDSAMPNPEHDWLRYSTPFP